MAQKLGRGTAASRISTRLRRLDSRLQSAEVSYFRACQSEFAQPVDVFDAAAKRAKNDPTRLKNDARLMNQTEAVLEQALANSRKLAVDHADLAVRETLTCLLDEMEWCERTLAARYATVGAQAVAQAMGAVDGIRDSALGVYDDATRKIQASFVSDARSKMFVAISRDETVVDIRRRWFSREPLRMHGQSGRGVWWQSLSSVQGSGQAVGIAITNSLREEAMVGFNDAYGAT